MKKLKELEAKIFADVACEAAEIVQTSKVEKATLGAGAGLVVMMATAANALAAPRFDVAIGSLLQKIYKYILGVSTGLAVVLIAWNLVKYMAATDPQSALQSKKAAIRVAIAWVVLNSLGALVAKGDTLKGGEYTGKWSS